MNGVLLVGVGVLAGGALFGAVAAVLSRRLAAVARSRRRRGTAYSTRPCGRCVVGLVDGAECTACDGMGLEPLRARPRLWLVPGARVVEPSGAIGTVVDPLEVGWLVTVEGPDLPAVSPLDSGLWPVRFDVEPDTVRWIAAYALDPVTPDDERLLARIADRRPRLS